MIVPFVGPTYQMSAVSFDNQRSVNLFLITSETGTSKSNSALIKTAGMKLFSEVGGGPIRNAFSSTSGRGFVASGNKLYEIYSDGSFDDRGALNSNSSRVSFAENNAGEIIIVDGLNGYIFTLSTDTLSQITDSDFPNGTKKVDYLDGYFICCKPETQNFYISNINDGMTWDTLDYAAVESSPDNLVSLVVDKGNVWFFGNRVTEVYYNAGTGFPFKRIQGAIVPTGCSATHTPMRFDNSIVWLGEDEYGRGVVWRAHTDGYAVTRISTQAIEKKIAESANFSNSYAWVYHEQGHIFYCLQVSGLDTTLVYDAATQQWHERSFRNSLLGRDEQHRGSCLFNFAKKNLIGDRQSGKIYELSLDYFDDAGDEIIWSRTTPHYDQEKKLIPHSSFELDCEVGRGLSSGQGSDPKIMMKYSDDGGRTWSNELWRSLGKVGEYKTRVVWRKLGSSKDRVYQVSGSDPVFIQINEAYLNAA